MNRLPFDALSRVMVLAPHPDDETLAAGGLLQQALAAGAAVRVLFLTDGANNPWGQRIFERRLRITPADRTRYGQRRRQEAMAALATLGVSAEQAIWLGYQDQGLARLLQLRDEGIVRDLACRITTWRPTLLVTPLPMDRHPDHRAAGHLTRLALDTIPADRQPAAHLEYLVHAPRSKRAVGRAIQLPLSDLQRDRKRQAILCHVSQVTVRPRRLLAMAGAFEAYHPYPRTTADDCRDSTSPAARISDGKRRCAMSQWKTTDPKVDAIVVGAGPNGLAAAIEVVRAGHPTVLLEAASTLGGGCRSAELTLPGFVHDSCAAILPLAVASPLFAKLPLADHGLHWIQPPVPLAHPLDDGSAILLETSLWQTAKGLGPDEAAYCDLMEPLVSHWHKLLPDILSPLYFPRHPLLLARFARQAVRSARTLVDRLFPGPRARALLAGLSAHSFLPLEQAPSAAFGLILAMLAHAVGWPIPRGGAQRFTDALAGYLRDCGGQIFTGVHVRSLRDLPAVRAVLMDVSPRGLEQIAGGWLPHLYRRQLKAYRYGPGVFKIDWALDEPIPWRADSCARAGTVHVGGTFEEIARAEQAVARGQHPDEPFVIVAQQSLFDPTRAPAGKHTGWAYCHVPNGSRVDMTERIERQIERFAPAFRKTILARHTRTAAQLQRYNPNFVGGDINGGLADIRQMLARPVVCHDPYTTPIEGLFLCSASTPPGGGVHGMCGYHAAREALRQLRKTPSQPAEASV